MVAHSPFVAIITALVAFHALVALFFFHLDFKIVNLVTPGARLLRTRSSPQHNESTPHDFGGLIIVAFHYNKWCRFQTHVTLIVVINVPEPQDRRSWYKQAQQLIRKRASCSTRSRFGLLASSVGLLKFYVGKFARTITSDINFSSAVVRATRERDR